MFRFSFQIPLFYPDHGRSFLPCLQLQNLGLCVVGLQCPLGVWGVWLGMLHGYFRIVCRNYHLRVSKAHSFCLSLWMRSGWRSRQGAVFHQLVRSFDYLSQTNFKTFGFVLGLESDKDGEIQEVPTCRPHSGWLVDELCSLCLVIFWPLISSFCSNVLWVSFRGVDSCSFRVRDATNPGGMPRGPSQRLF